MANYNMVTFKLPDQLTAMETAVEAIDDTALLQVTIVPERTTGKSIAILIYKTI